METRTRTPEWKLDKKETTDLEADNQNKHHSTRENRNRPSKTQWQLWIDGHETSSDTKDTEQKEQKKKNKREMYGIGKRRRKHNHKAPRNYKVNNINRRLEHKTNLQPVENNKRNRRWIQRQGMHIAKAA